MIISETNFKIENESAANVTIFDRERNSVFIPIESVFGFCYTLLNNGYVSKLSIDLPDLRSRISGQIETSISTDEIELI